MTNMNIRAKSLDEKLSEKQDRFIDYWIELADATKAAIKAGYSVKSAKQIGSQNLTKLDLFITRRMDELGIKKNRIGTSEEVLEFLTQGMRGELKGESVHFWEGEITQAEVKMTIKERINCALLLGKRYRLFIERIEQETDNEIIVRMEGPLKDWCK